MEQGDKPDLRSVIYGLQKCGLEFVIVDEVDCLIDNTSSDVCIQLLTNDIFNDELFNTNERLVALRDTIVSGVTGKDCLDLTSGHEWFWLYAALYDAGALETRKNRDNVVTDAGFVRQMAKWLFNVVGTIHEERVRQICKGSLVVSALFVILWCQGPDITPKLGSNCRDIIYMQLNTTIDFPKEAPNA